MNAVNISIVSYRIRVIKKNPQNVNTLKKFKNGIIFLE